MHNVANDNKEKTANTIFDLRYVFIPVNIRFTHWFLVTVKMDTTHPTITVCDSSSSSPRTSRMDYLNHVHQYIQDEYAKVYGNKPDKQWVDRWNLIDCGGSYNDVPQQQNGYDCGIFTCVFVYFMVMSFELKFDQSHVDLYRPIFALSTIDGKLRYHHE